MNVIGAVRQAAGSGGRPWRTFADWLFNRRGREPAPIRLTQRRIFLLPTRHGLFFALVLLVMLGGSINYALSLGFVLTFLLGPVGFLLHVVTRVTLRRAVATDAGPATPMP